MKSTVSGVDYCSMFALEDMFAVSSWEWHSGYNALTQYFHILSTNPVQELLDACFVVQFCFDESKVWNVFPIICQFTRDIQFLGTAHALSTVLNT